MAGGLDSPSMAGAATAAVYGTGAFTSLFASVPCNILGPRVTLFVGTLGYWLYVLSLLMYKLGATGALLGGRLRDQRLLLWPPVGCTRPANVPLCWCRWPLCPLGLFWLVFSLGAVTGGLLSFGENFDDDRAHKPPWAPLSRLSV